MKLSFLKIITVSFSFILMITMFSCVEDEISGCTDPDAENYNQNAVNDLGNCIFASDNEIGAYVGTTQCDGSLSTPGFNSSSLNFSISRSATGGANDVDVAFAFEATPFIFEGVVLGDQVIINDVIMGVEYPNPANQTEIIMVNVEGDGIMSYFDDDGSIVCPDFFIKITNAGSGSPLQDGECSITGIKQ